MQTKRINTLVVVLSVLLVVCLGAVGIVSFAHTNAVKAAEEGWTDPATGVIWDSEAKNKILYVNADHKYYLDNNTPMDLGVYKPDGYTDTLDPSGKVTVSDTPIIRVDASSFKSGSITLDVSNVQDLRYASINIYFTQNVYITNITIIGTEFLDSLTLGAVDPYLAIRLGDEFDTASIFSVHLEHFSYATFSPSIQRSVNVEKSLLDVTNLPSNQKLDLGYIGCVYSADDKILFNFYGTKFVKVDKSIFTNIKSLEDYYRVYADLGKQYDASHSYFSFAPNNLKSTVLSVNNSMSFNDALTQMTMQFEYNDTIGSRDAIRNAWQVSDTFMDDMDRYKLQYMLGIEQITFFDLQITEQGSGTQYTDIETFEFLPNKTYKIDKLYVRYEGAEDSTEVEVGQVDGVPIKYYNSYTVNRGGATITTLDANEEKTATADWSKFITSKDYTGAKVTYTAPTVTLEDDVTKIKVNFIDATPYLTADLVSQGYKVAESLDGATNAGKYIIAIAPMEGQGKITITNPYFLFEIKPVQLQVEWSNTNVDYNGQPQSPNIAFKTPAGVPIDIPVEVPSYTDAKTYQVSVEVPDQFEKNYTFTGGALSTTFTINKVRLNITWTDPIGGIAIEDNQWSRQFASLGEVNVTVALPKVTGGIGSEVEIVFSTGDGTYTRPGTYNVSVEIKDKSVADNYIFEDTSKTLVIKVEGLQEVPVIWGELGEGVVTSTAVYTGSTLAYPTPTATLADSPLTLNITITKSGVGVIDASQIIDAGTYYIDVTTDEEAILLYSQLTFTVTPAEVQLDWPENTFVYTGKAHTPVLPTATFNGDNVEVRFVGGVVPTASLVGKTTFSVELVSGNFKFAESEKGVGTMTITPATIDVSKLSAIYNAAAHSSVVVDGVAGEKLTLNLAYAGAMKDVGTYTVQVTFAQPNSNYQLANSFGTFTITPRELTVTWWETSFEFTYEEGKTVIIREPILKGVVGGDLVTLSFEGANSFTAPGEYTVTVKIDNPNYTIANATQTVKIVEPTPEPEQPEGENPALIITLSVVGVGLVGALSYILVTVIKRRSSK